MKLYVSFLVLSYSFIASANLSLNFTSSKKQIPSYEFKQNGDLLIIAIGKQEQRLELNDCHKKNLIQAIGDSLKTSVYKKCDEVGRITAVRYPKKSVPWCYVDEPKEISKKLFSCKKN